MSVLRNFFDETEFPFVSISLDLSNKTHTVTVDSFSQVNKTDSEEGLRKPRPRISNNWSDIAFVMSSSHASHFIWSETYAHKFAETLPYVILSILAVYIYIYKL